MIYLPVPLILNTSVTLTNILSLMMMVTSISRAMLTIIVLYKWVFARLHRPIQEEQHYPTGHGAICLVVLIDLHIVPVAGAVCPAAPRDFSQSCGYPPLWCGATQYDQSTVAQRLNRKFSFRVSLKY